MQFLARSALSIALLVLLTVPVFGQTLNPGEPSTVTPPPDPGPAIETWSRETTGISSNSCGDPDSKCAQATFAALVADLAICLPEPDWNPEEGGCLRPCRIWTNEELIDWFDGVTDFEGGVTALLALLSLACGDVEVEINIYKAGLPHLPPAHNGPATSNPSGNTTVNRYDQYNFDLNTLRFAFDNAVGECAFAAALGGVSYTNSQATPPAWNFAHMISLTSVTPFSGYGSLGHYDPQTNQASNAFVHSTDDGHFYWSHPDFPAVHLEEFITITVDPCEDDCTFLFSDVYCELTSDADAEPEPPKEESGGGDQTE